MQKMMGLVRRCIEDYNMIEAGDRVAVGVSGGKDSLTLLVVLAALREYYPIKFDLAALSVDMGLGGMDFSPVAELCVRLNVPYLVKKTEIGPIIFDYRKEKNPCSMCAKMRRGALNDLMREQGYNKIALGHHYDDAVETFLMSLLFEGRIGCFEPVTYHRHHADPPDALRRRTGRNALCRARTAPRRPQHLSRRQAHQAAGGEGADRRAASPVSRPENEDLWRDAAPAAAAVGHFGREKARMTLDKL